MRYCLLMTVGLLALYGNSATGETCMDAKPSIEIPMDIVCPEIRNESQIAYCGCMTFVPAIPAILGPVECYVKKLVELIDSNNVLESLQKPAAIDAIKQMVTDLAPIVFDVLCNNTLLDSMSTCVNSGSAVPEIDVGIKKIANIDALFDFFKNDLCLNRELIMGVLNGNLECIIGQIPGMAMCGYVIPLGSFAENVSASLSDMDNYCPLGKHLEECGLTQLGHCNSTLRDMISGMITKIIQPSCYDSTSQLLDNYLLNSKAIYCALNVASQFTSLFSNTETCVPNGEIPNNDIEEIQIPSEACTSSSPDIENILKSVYQYLCSGGGLSTILPCIENYVQNSSRKMDKMIRSIIDLKQLTLNAALEQDICSEGVLADIENLIKCASNITNIGDLEMCVSNDMQFWASFGGPTLDLSFMPDSEVDISALMCPKITNTEACLLNFTAAHSCTKDIGYRAGNITSWLKKENCGGDHAASKLANYINVDLTALGEPSVAASLGEGSESVEGDGTVYVTKGIEFACQFTISDTVKDNLLYDVYFYINEDLMQSFQNLQYSGLASAKLMESTWTSKIAMPFNVYCAYQAKISGDTTYGTRKKSEAFFAGIQVSKKKITMEEGDKDSFSIALTVPWGYKYIKGSTTDQINAAKEVYKVSIGFYTQTNETTSQCTSLKSFKNTSALSFVNGDCISSFDDWNAVKTRTVRANPDNTNLYYRSETIHLFWISPALDMSQLRKVPLPSIKVDIYDRDGQSYGQHCSCVNDPHCKTFDGWNFENQNPGIFLMYRHTTYPYEVQAAFQQCWNNPTPTCNCGFSVRNGKSMFIVDFCENNNFMTKNFCEEDSMHIVTTDTRIEVTLPTGTFIRAEVSLRNAKYSISSILIKPSAADFNKTTGLCGIYDNNKANDFTKRDGQISDFDVGSSYWSSNQMFSLSWKVQPNEFTPFEYQEVPNEDPLIVNNKEESFSVCVKAGNTVEEKISKGLELCQSNTDSIFQIGDCTKRKKRSTSTPQLNISPSPLSGLKNTAVVASPDLNSWTDNVNYNASSAKSHCETFFNSVLVVEKCAQLLKNFSKEQYIEMCVQDINLLDNDGYITETREALLASCLTTAKSDVNLTESSSGSADPLIKELLDVACPNNCSNNGTCIDGTCTCLHNLKGEDCSQNPSIPPAVFSSSSSICKTNMQTCNTFSVSGSNFIRDMLTCRSKEIKIFKAGNHTVSNTSQIFPGTYVNRFTCICQVPVSRRRRSTGDASDVYATGYSIAVSNDNGTTFSSDITFVAYNATCYTCDPMTLSCTQTNSACSPQDEKKKKEVNVGVIIGAVVGSIAFVLIVVFIIFMATRRSSNKKEINEEPPYSEPIDRERKAPRDTDRNTYDNRAYYYGHK